MWSTGYSRRQTRARLTPGTMIWTPQGELLLIIGWNPIPASERRTAGHEVISINQHGKLVITDWVTMAWNLKNYGEESLLICEAL